MLQPRWLRGLWELLTARASPIVQSATPVRTLKLEMGAGVLLQDNESRIYRWHQHAVEFLCEIEGYPDIAAVWILSSNYPTFKSLVAGIKTGKLKKYAGS